MHEQIACVARILCCSVRKSPYRLSRDVSDSVGGSLYGHFQSAAVPPLQINTVTEFRVTVQQSSTHTVNCERSSVGMQEIVAFVDETRQKEKDERNKADEYDGLSPDEINAMAAAKAKA